MSSVADASFWRGKRVLLTGHTGFKGAWLTLWLERLGAEVTGISLAPATTPNLFTDAKIEALCRSHFCDIRDATALAALIRAARPDIIFHLAAQALVREGYRAPLETFSANVMGTAHVLDALRGLDSARVAVMITTDKVYRDSEPPRPYREDDALGGHDPYSASKAACELVIAGYRDAFLDAQGVKVASARAGNVIGGGDWSADRLIPDAMRAWQAGEVLHLRRPLAVRPWQYVLEPLAGYITLAQKLWQGSAPAGAYNFGPEAGSAVRVRDVVEFARSAYGQGTVTYGDGSDGPRESAWLALAVSKAREVLGVAPALPLEQAVARTMAWYRAYAQGSDARELCAADLAWFESLALTLPAAGKRAAGG
jgi:CDP-glucose 4,6-dehydratase